MTTDAARLAASGPGPGASEAGGRFDPILHRWFIRYNPLYFASAMLVLAGVFVMAREIGCGDALSHASIAGIAQLYAFALIGGAWLLLRHTADRRPAVILGLAALVFSFDPAFCSERLASVEGAGLLLTAAFAALGPVKLMLLAFVFRIRGAIAPILVASAVLVAIPLLPNAIEAAAGHDTIREPLHLAFTWLGAGLLAWALLSKPAPFWSDLITDDWSAVVTSRVASVLPLLITALFAVHAAAWSVYLAVPLTPAHGAPFLLAAGAAHSVWLARSARPAAAELAAWVAAGGAVLAAARLPWAAASIALVAAAVLATLVRTHGLRLVLPSLLCAFAGGVLATGGHPAPVHYAVLAFALLGGASMKRHLECLAASAVALTMSLDGVPLPMSALAGVVWFGPWAWLLYPDHRRWLPVAAIAAVQALAAWQHAAWPEMTAFCAAASAIPFALGLALHRKDWIAAGAAGAFVLARVSGGWGVALVLAGFAALAGGLALNLSCGRRTEDVGLGTDLGHRT